MVPHVPPTQAAAPLGSPGQATQVAPQAVASSSAAHRSPQRWKPGPQVKEHCVPSQLVTLAPEGFGHVVQEPPHESTLLLDRHKPLQL